MSDDPRVFKPTFYTATLVFAVTVIVLVLIMSGIMASVPETRGHMAIFVSVVAAGGAVVVAQTFSRIWQAEKAYVHAAHLADESNSLLGCPDNHVTDGALCVPVRAETPIEMSMDESLVDADVITGSRLKHSATSIAGLDVAAARTATKGDFIGTYCKKAEWHAAPWATFKALCPAPEA
jgi:hypothetical protein